MPLSVYWIHHKDHTDMFSQGYVGVSVNAAMRFGQHLKRTQNAHLKNAIAKYGWENLVKQQILIADKDYCLKIEKQLRPTNNVGWNIVAGGGLPPLSKKGVNAGRPSWNKGKKSSLETRQKLSIIAKEQMKDPVRREINRLNRLGMESPMKGLKHSAETRLKMSLSKKGKPSKRKGIKVAAETIDKIKQTNLAYQWICTHCSKQGYGKPAANRWHFDKCKYKGINICR